MVWGAVIGAAAAIGGGLLAGAASKSEVSKARDWQADQYARRYQITMNDMRAAGLNPMLAYSHGPGASPTGFAADQSAIQSGFSSAGSIAAQARIRKEQADQAEATTKREKSTTKLQNEQARHERLRMEKTKQETATEFQRQQHVAAGAAKLTTEQKRAAAELQRFLNRGDAWISRNYDAIVKLVREIFGEKDTRKAGPGHPGYRKIENPVLRALGITSITDHSKGRK